MPTISFNVGTGRYAILERAIQGYNINLPPAQTVDTVDLFAKKVALQQSDIYASRWDEWKLDTVKAKLAACDTATWNQIGAILSGIVIPDGN